MDITVDRNNNIWIATNVGVLQFNPYGIVTDVEDENSVNIPKEFSLSQNYPNPFNPETAISYQLSAFSFVSLKVFDVLGREVATLVNEEKPAGTYTINFNAEGLSSGVYFYRLQVYTPERAGSFVQTKKLVFMK
ncbi:MAG: T9SS type A sorting domain-containing protein [Bacteroidetes bacterium]|nr:T9SS type A sorting domain-containing protein [Bacteroidota bacterium]